MVLIGCQGSCNPAWHSALFSGGTEPPPCMAFGNEVGRVQWHADDLEVTESNIDEFETLGPGAFAAELPQTPRRKTLHGMLKRLILLMERVKGIEPSS